MEVDWLRREQKHPHIFSRQLEELGIINISCELVAPCTKKFAPISPIDPANHVGFVSLCRLSLCRLICIPMNS